MKLLLQIPLFVFILIIYNLALIANRDALKEHGAQEDAVRQPTAVVVPAPPVPQSTPAPGNTGEVPAAGGAAGIATPPPVIVPGTTAQIPAPPPGGTEPASVPAPAVPGQAPQAPQATETPPQAPGASPAAPASAAPERHPPQSRHPLDKVLFSIGLPSKATMPITTHEFLLVLAVIFLYIELFKSTKTGNATIVEHVLSLMVFMAFFVELIVYRPAGTPTFLIMTLLSFLDVIAGFTITISTARRDFGLGSHADAQS